jgi:hypothetical protein
VHHAQAVHGPRLGAGTSAEHFGDPRIVDGGTLEMIFRQRRKECGLSAGQFREDDQSESPEGSGQER